MDFGCKHYKRNVKFVTPCCNHIYVCRHCHDDEEDHPLNTKSVSSVVCFQCETKQDISQKCRHCDIQFGEAYSCLLCPIFDNEYKYQYHCISCDTCRVGPRDLFFHCDTCNLCLNKKLLANHKCIDNVSHDKCPICITDLHRSRSNITVLKCGHLLHEECMTTLTSNELKECSVCKQPLESVLDYIKSIES